MPFPSASTLRVGGRGRGEGGGGGIWMPAIKLCSPKISIGNTLIFIFFNRGWELGGTWMPVIKPRSPRISIGLKKNQLGWGGGGGGGGGWRRGWRRRGSGCH